MAASLPPQPPINSPLAGPNPPTNPWQIYLAGLDSALRSLLGSISTSLSSLGTAAFLNVGTGAGNVVQIDGTDKLPAVDGSQLTGIGSGKLVAGTPLVLNPYAPNTVVNQAHGLGVVPVYVRFQLECLTAELGYSVGDILGNFVSSAVAVGVTSVNVFALTFNGSASILNAATRLSGTLTPANWKLTLTPYKLT